MEKATVINVTRFCTEDGPGIRTTVFLKGCPLSCAWCHNPESQCPHIELLYQEQKCVGCAKCARVCPKGAHVFDQNGHKLDRALCVACGACAEKCPVEALSLSGEEMTADEVFAEVERDKIFYKTSGGGVTLSGGEPLARPEFTVSLLEKCHTAGLHTAIETSGFASPEVLARILPLCDLVLFDLKETDPTRHKQFTGIPLAPILQNLKELDRAGIPVHLRLPIIPGYNDREEHFAAVREIANSLNCIKRVEVMPYHAMGAYKYAALGRDYLCTDVTEPTSATVAEWRRLVGDTTRELHT